MFNRFFCIFCISFLSLGGILLFGKMEPKTVLSETQTIRTIPLSNIDSAASPIEWTKEYLKNFQKEAYCKISVPVRSIMVMLDSPTNFNCQWEENIWISSLLSDEKNNIFRVHGVISRDVPVYCHQDEYKIWTHSMWTMTPNLRSVWSLHNMPIVVNNEYFVIRTLQDGEEKVTKNLPECVPNIRLKK